MSDTSQIFKDLLTTTTVAMTPERNHRFEERLTLRRLAGQQMFLD
jgi:hypothetical protein